MRVRIKRFACRSTACAQTEVNTTAASRKKVKQTQTSVVVLHRWSFMEIRWVEHKPPASYFCSKNALSKAMKTIFEVAPAGKY